MNVTRIEVPLDLPEPHFDDEATVVSARRVVPLSRARLSDRWRKLLRLLPIFLAATLCGALGALAVNHLERRASAPTISSQFGVEREPQTSPAPASPAVVAPAPTGGIVIAGESAPQSTENAGQAPAESADAAEKTSDARAVPSKDNQDEAKKAGQTDPRQLVRPRRVKTSAGPRPSQNDESKTGGAGRIQDIFSGPNP